MLLTKEQILAHRLKTERVDIGDGEIIVRALPTHVIERAKAVTAPEYGEDAYLFVNAVIDDAGKRLYTDEDAGAIAQTVDPGLIALVVSKAYQLAAVPAEMQERIKKNWNALAGKSSGESPSPSGTPIPT